MKHLAAIVVSLALTPLALAVTPLAHVEVEGRGKTHLVLIPGLGSDWTVWEDFMDRNKRDYTMHAVTLPGFAGTDAPPFPADDDTGTPWLENAIAAIAEYIEDEDIAGAWVVGHSMGGHLAARFGIEKPNLISGVISIDGFVVAPIGTELTGDARRQAIETGFVAQIRNMGNIWWEQFAVSSATMVEDQDRAEQIAGMMRKTKPDVAGQYIIELFRSDLRDEISTTDSPTLFLAARADNMMPTQEITEYWKQSVGASDNVELQFIDRARHFIMDDQPDAMDEAIEDFVK